MGNRYDNQPEKEKPFMAAKVENETQSQQSDGQIAGDGKRVACSIGIMAYNEEANIARTIYAVLAQQGPSIRIQEVIVVASGCTDNTVPIVTEITEKEPRVHLFPQEKREGKASAINLFLKKATGDVAGLIG